MKKYLFGMFAIVMAIGLNSFNTAKRTLTYTFTIDRVPTSESSIEQTFTNEDDDNLYYANWDHTATAVLTSCSLGNERACTIVVDAKYTNLVDGVRFLNAEDPDAGGTKIAFPTMDAAIGSTIGLTHYYIVANFQEYNQIHIINGTVN
jgi:hypothetical protein